MNRNPKHDAFREAPSGEVTLAVIGSQKMTTLILTVHGYDRDRDAWYVSVVKNAVEQGLYGHSITVYIVRASSGEWIILHEGGPAVPVQKEEAQ